jgi:chitin disaccharide deacetylase
MAAASRIITRADDLASYRAALPAMQEGVKAGTLKCVGVMACGLYLDEALPWLRTLEGVDIGLHFCLNAEFFSPKWGPVSQIADVSSLVEADGSFTPSPMRLHERGFSVDEAAAELEAQFNLLVDQGISVHYLDEHMGVAWLPGLRERVAEFAQQKGLLYDPERSGIPYGRDGDFAASVLASFLRPEADGRLFVVHPAADGAEMRSLLYEGASPGQVAMEREEDRRFFTDPRVLDSMKRGDWTPIRWTEA